MSNRKLLSLFCVLVVGVNTFLGIAKAQSEKVVKIELKPEVKVELLKDQNDLYKLALQMKQLEAQYQQGQAAMTKLQAKLQSDTHEALTKSGIDAEKFEINGETFDVTPKVVVAEKK